MLVDLHVHSEYSDDAKPNASIYEICKAAAAKNIKTIALTDHKEFYFTQPEMPLDIAAQQQDIVRCQTEFAGSLTILSGIELGQIHASAQAQAYIDAHVFDEVIGSLHVRRANDKDIYFQDYESIDQTAFLKEYFTDLLEMVRVGGFDILAHIEYPLRVMKLPHNMPSFVGFEAMIEPILREIIDREIALEINAAGLFGWQKRVGPEDFVLDMYRNLGGSMITVGSDSHCAADVGRGIAQCLARAKAFGFDELVIYRGRKPQPITI